MIFWKKNRKTFFDFFEEHSQITYRAASTLKQLFDLSISNEEACKKIIDDEHRGDSITHEVIKQLCIANFIPPLDHQDILALIHTLDDVLDHIKDSAEAYVEIYALNQPTPFAKQLVTVIERGAQALVMLCPLLRYPSKNSLKIRQLCIEIHSLENQADNLKKEALKELFSRYTGSKLDVAWDRIYSFLEVITDKVEDCANIADQIVMKYS